MKYLLLYMADEMAVARLPAGELDRIVAEKTRVGQELWAQGKEILGQRLWPTAAATRVSRTGAQYVAIDGPFAETKESVAGFDLIQCDSKEEAIEWAKRMLPHDSGVVEVRPVWERCLCHGAFDCSSRI
ncbi:MAG: YciI family protein [Candidatus Binatia bacterium]